MDSDIDRAETEGGCERPVHLRWQFLALVALGGVIGTALRELLTIAVPPLAGVPVVTMGVNLLGALLLGAFLESLERRGSDQGRRRQARLLLGTGALGGFTTYSALATDTTVLLSESQLTPALLYAFGTLLGGAVASWAGITLSAHLHRLGTGAVPTEATR